jgi:hypothetical protein
VKDILIPSEERRMDLNPLDFEEWLWATDGSGLLADAIDEAFRARTPLPDALHKLAMRSLREYLLVGGMPQSIEAYGADKDFFAADQAKRQILDVYRSDMFKYGGNDAAKVAAIFNQIPGQLSRHEKRFVMASLGSEARYREYAEAVFWLGDSHIANICRKASDGCADKILERSRHVGERGGARQPGKCTRRVGAAAETYASGVLRRTAAFHVYDLP